jgi:uncharacterized protein (DUF3820 family)
MDIEAVAHDAWGDILVLEQLYLRLLKSMMKRFDIDEDEARGQMLEISMVPSIIRKIQFGKHKGRLTADIAKEDRGYLEWLLKEKLKEPDGEEDWIYTLNQLLA